MAPESYAATVDRIVDGERVVVLVEDEGDVVDEVVLSSAEYPDLAEGDVLTVTLEDGDVLDLKRDPDATERRRRELEDRFDRLSERLPDGDGE